jgi:hypothetical protein
MTFNPIMNLYEVKILMKQGFHNYNYVVLNQDNSIDRTAINGSFDETENEYQVLVYYFKFGSKYAKVIGYGTGSSRNLGQ